MPSKNWAIVHTTLTILKLYIRIHPTLYELLGANMRTPFQVSTKLSIIMTAVFLTACGGGGGSGDGNTATKSGAFVDSPVAGLSYRTSTQTGTTDSSGSFNYREGEMISFSLGDLLLGSFVGSSVITPVEISNAFSVENTKVTNLARLLQTLDADNDPSNGIELIPAANNLPDTVDLNNATSIQNALNSLGGSLTLVDTNDALDHLRSTLASIPNRGPADSYTYVTAANYPFDNDCDTVKWNDATLNVTGTGGSLSYSGQVSKSNGGVETFNLIDTNSGTTSAGTSIIIDADNLAAEIQLGLTPAAACRGKIHMTTNDAVNLPPIAGRNSPFTMGICGSANGTYFWGFDGYAGDRDGYIAKHPTFSYTVDGSPEVQLIVGANAEGIATYGSARIPIRIDRAEILDISCTKGFTWEYIVEDNEGAVSIESGSFDAPYEATFATGDNDYCAENYPLEACDLLNDDSGTETRFSANQSCASAFPDSTNLGDFGCSGQGIFSSCGACGVDFDTAAKFTARPGSRVDKAYLEALMN